MLQGVVILSVRLPVTGLDCDKTISAVFSSDFAAFLQVSFLRPRGLTQNL